MDDDAVIQSFAHGEVVVPGSGWWIRLPAVRWEVQRAKSHLNCGFCAGCRTVIHTAGVMCFVFYS
jgi:hypothetical protein